jgi:hypothetical protein
MFYIFSFDKTSIIFSVKSHSNDWNNLKVKRIKYISNNYKREKKNLLNKMQC